MSIPSNYTSTGYVPTSTSNVQSANVASGSSETYSVSGDVPTGTSDVVTRSTITYTTQAPHTNTVSSVQTTTNPPAAEPGTSKAKNSPASTPNVSGTSPVVSTPTSTPDPLLTTLTDPVTGRPTSTVDPFADFFTPTISSDLYDVTPSNNVMNIPESFEFVGDLLNWYNSLPVKYDNKQIACCWQMGTVKYQLGIGELINKYNMDPVFKKSLKGVGFTLKFTF